MERRIYRRQVAKIQNYISLVDFFVVGKGSESLASPCRLGHVEKWRHPIGPGVPNVSHTCDGKFHIYVLKLLFRDISP